MTRSKLKAWTSALLVLAACLPWLVRSDVERLVVLQRHVLLGRYSAGWFFALAFGITPGCLVAAWAVWRSRTVPHRQIVFRLVALGFALLLGYGLVEVAARMLRRPTYVETNVAGQPEWPIDQQVGQILHRQPDQRHELVFDDVPPPARSYPGRPRGYPRHEMTLTTDARGFRNPVALEQADLVVVGDSFAEGCLVGDDEALPVLLGRDLGMSVYNLGMSGADPQHYRDALLGIGLGLKPKVVVVLLYEDNDFDGARQGGASEQGGGIAGFFRASPVFEGLTNALVSWLGPIGADAPLRDFDAISAWMPLRREGIHGEATYALKPKRLLQLATPRAAFEASYGWTSTVPILDDVVEACRKAGVHLTFALVPSKPRVVMSSAWDRIGPEGLYAFVGKRRDPGMTPEAFRDALRDNWRHRQEAVRDFCASRGVPFVSLADDLELGAQGGMQVYYAYDQHWTPVGHRIAAATLADALPHR